MGIPELGYPGDKTGDGGLWMGINTAPYQDGVLCSPGAEFGPQYPVWDTDTALELSWVKRHMCAGLPAGAGLDFHDAWTLQLEP